MQNINTNILANGNRSSLDGFIQIQWLHLSPLVLVTIPLKSDDMKFPQMNLCRCSNVITPSVDNIFVSPNSEYKGIVCGDCPFLDPAVVHVSLYLYTTFEIINIIRSDCNRRAIRWNSHSWTKSKILVIVSTRLGNSAQFLPKIHSRGSRSICTKLSFFGINY